MTATLPTQEQVDKIAAELAPDVLRIRLTITTDWADEPALYFRVTIRDAVSRGDRLRDTTRKIRAKLAEGLSLADLEHFPYFKFRNQSEQAELNDPAWA